MTNFTFTSSKYEEKKLEELWGSSWKRLTPKQRQLVVEIFTNQTKK